jgi:hypothetical protein
MNLTLADIKALMSRKEEIADLGHPWNAAILNLVEDWLEMAHKPFDAAEEGLNIAKVHEAGNKLIAEIDALEEVLRLPLCGPCRKLIGGIGA